MHLVSGTHASGEYVLKYSAAQRQLNNRTRVARVSHAFRTRLARVGHAGVVFARRKPPSSETPNRNNVICCHS